MDSRATPTRSTTTVAGLTLSEWTLKFWEWLQGLSDESNPVTVVGPARPWRFAGRQPLGYQKDDQLKYGESVWFVAPAPYAEPGSVIQITLPEGRWYLLVAPATTCAALEHFASIRSLNKLREHVLKDIHKTYELWTIFDGFSVPWYYVDNTDRLIKIRLPESSTNKPKNIINPVTNVPNNEIHTAQAGYWNLIGPVWMGDHLLTIHSRSPIYRVDVTYQISAVGPNTTRVRVYDGIHGKCSACMKRLSLDSPEIETENGFKYHIKCRYGNKSRIRFSNHCRTAKKSEGFARY